MGAGIGRFVSVDPKGIAEKDLLNPQRLNRYNYSLNNPYRYIDPDGKETIVIITRDKILGITYGSHSAVRVDNPTGGGPVLYDPAGTVYNPKDEYGGPLRGSGDKFTGEAADLDKYKAAQEKNGSSVKLYRFNTTPEQEKQIADRIDKLGGQKPLACTVGVCQAIQGIGPFKDVGTYRMPGNLEDKLQEIKKEHP